MEIICETIGRFSVMLIPGPNFAKVSSVSYEDKRWNYQIYTYIHTYILSYTITDMATTSTVFFSPSTGQVNCETWLMLFHLKENSCPCALWRFNQWKGEVFQWTIYMKMPSSGMLGHVTVRTDVSGESSASIIRVTRVSKERTLEVTNNCRKLRRNFIQTKNKKKLRGP
jgi:hypothetical protein